MIVISDSSPLISLLSVEKLDILGKLFETVMIPEAVYNEVFNKKVSNLDLKKTKFLQIEKVTDRKMVKLLKMQLGYGESEVIALALEKGIDRVIIDDKQARKVADKLGLKVIGTLGILILAKEKQVIKEVRPLVLSMMEKINFRIDRALLNKILGILNEKLI